ncbi:hypothetical protein OKW96_20310 [Sphingobacterium sp. KU25419]|nr:hypothetical protein OKW96_20310 [Sphingobacterium sp. KU25419]
MMQIDEHASDVDVQTKPWPLLLLEILRGIKMPTERSGFLKPVPHR